MTDPEAEAVATDIGKITGLIDQSETFLCSLFRPWNAYKAGIVVALLAASWVLERILGPHLRTWMAPRGGLTNIRSNVYLALWDAFRAHNISIPFPQREVRMLDDKAG